MALVIFILDLYAAPHFFFEKYYFSYFKSPNRDDSPEFSVRVESAVVCSTLPISLLFYLFLLDKKLIVAPTYESLFDLIGPLVIIFIFAQADKYIFYRTGISKSSRERYNRMTGLEKGLTFILAYILICFPVFIYIIETGQ